MGMNTHAGCSPLLSSKRGRDGITSEQGAKTSNNLEHLVGMSPSIFALIPLCPLPQPIPPMVTQHNTMVGSKHHAQERAPYAINGQTNTCSMYMYAYQFPLPVSVPIAVAIAPFVARPKTLTHQHTTTQETNRSPSQSC